MRPQLPALRMKGGRGKRKEGEKERKGPARWGGSGESGIVVRVRPISPLLQPAWPPGTWSPQPLPDPPSGKGTECDRRASPQTQSRRQKLAWGSGEGPAQREPCRARGTRRPKGLAPCVFLPSCPEALLSPSPGPVRWGSLPAPGAQCRAGCAPCPECTPWPALRSLRPRLWSPRHRVPASAGAHQDSCTAVSSQGREHPSGPRPGLCVLAGAHGSLGFPQWCGSPSPSPHKGERNPQPPRDPREHLVLLVPPNCPAAPHDLQALWLGLAPSAWGKYVPRWCASCESAWAHSLVPSAQPGLLGPERLPPVCS